MCCLFELAGWLKQQKLFCHSSGSWTSKMKVLAGWFLLGLLSLAYRRVYVILHSCQKCTGVLVAPYPFQKSILSVLLIVAILVFVQWSHIIVFIFTSVMTNDIGHFHVCNGYLLFFFVKCLLKSFAHILKFFHL